MICIVLFRKKKIFSDNVEIELYKNRLHDSIFIFKPMHKQNNGHS